MPERVCVITGASKGIGRAAALRFARAGATVVALARGADELTRLATEIQSAGGRCVTLAVDVADGPALRAAIARAHQQGGRIDVLVNNAGVAPLTPIDQLSLDDFDRLFRVNIAAVFHATQAVWPLMRAQGGGVIVNISSASSADPFRGFAAYGASKAWVNIYSKAAADEGKAHGIRVYSVAPGAVETGLLRSIFPDIPAAQTLAPDAVAAVIESVADPRMASATGQTIFVRK